MVAQETRGARGRGTGLPESHGQVTTVIASFLGFVASLLDPALKLPATYALVTRIRIASMLEQVIWMRGCAVAFERRGRSNHLRFIP